MRHAVEGVEAGAEQDLVHWQRSIGEPCRILGSGQCMLSVKEGPVGDGQKMTWQVDQ